MNCRALCCLLQAFFLLLLPLAWAEAPPFRVLDYDTRIDIETSGDIIVTEAITISLPAGGEHRGIVRNIPVNPRWRDLARQKVELRVESITLDGKPCRTDDHEEDYPRLRIFMRDTGSYLNAGEHRFVLRYRMSEQIGFFEENDELTWNAVGEGWRGGVQQARALVVPPPGAGFTQQHAWLGKRGSQDSPISIREVEAEGRRALLFEALRPIRHGEAFTLAAAWPKGAVAAPSSLRPADQWGHTLTYALCFLASLGGAYVLWYLYGRDPKLGAVIPLFYPPKVPPRLRRAAAKAAGKNKQQQRYLHKEEYMTPAAVHYINTGGTLGGRGLAATFLSLAQRGDCRLEGNGRRGIVLRKHSNTSPAPEERAVAGQIPRRLELRASEKAHSPIGSMHRACQERLDADYPTAVAWHIAPQLWLCAGLALLLYLTARNQVGAFLSPLVCEELRICLAGALLTGAGSIGLAITLRKVRRVGRLRADSGHAVYLLLCVLLIILGILRLTDADALWIFSPLQWGLMLATLATPMLFAFLMDAPTREQVKLQRDIKGLALYISTAETARFNTLNPPEEDLQLYHRLLPYAVALGLEEAWGKRFADKLNEAMARERGMATEFSTAFTQQLVLSSCSSVHSWQAAVEAERAAVYGSDSGGGSSFGDGGGGAGFGGGGGGGDLC